ncbi:hypothetical protein CK203_097168 [Vitis vinifera]|uniref:Uncharacterized protein n=1 Tax=Vitis vinifera TaxID=29760 RepID=A0A438EUM7_VITVI|nr:hypothetical protein CK203_097168 [Vitis vinifera]
MGQNFGEEWGEIFSGNNAFSGEFLLLCNPVVLGGAAMDLCSAQGNLGLEYEGPAIISSSRMGWALKERETSGPKACWEEGQPSIGVERASCDDPSNILWDGLSCVDSRPKSVWKEGQTSVGAIWASNPQRAFLDEPLKEARALFCRLRLEGWFAEELLAGGIVLK